MAVLRLTLGKRGTNGAMPDEDPLATRLRRHGLRATLQRRAILRSFAGGRSEHLTAEEVHERARGELPGLARATVYNTLGELVGAGLLRVFGRVSPLRYECEVDVEHHHFRCLACRRLYDVFPEVARRLDPPDDEFDVERVHVLLEGTCADCGELEHALRRAADEERARVPPAARVRLAYATLESPLGAMLAVAGERGLVRLGFDGEHPEPVLRALAADARVELEEADDGLEHVRRQLHEYFDGERRFFDLPVDLSSVELRHRRVLRYLTEVSYGETADYAHVTDVLDGPHGGRHAGEALGGNPVLLLVPCHRVLRADGRLGDYAGGAERKRWLLDLEGPER